MKYAQSVNNMKSGMVKVMKDSNIVSEGILVCKISYIKTFFIMKQGNTFGSEVHGQTTQRKSRITKIIL